MSSRIFSSFALITLLVLSTGFSHQNKSPKFIQFNNFSASFEVPVGKTWVIQQIFSGFTTDVTTDTNGTAQTVPVRIFIKTLNGDIKTDYAGNRYGPQVFQSNNTAATVAYPIVLPEKTSFSLVIVKGDPGACTAYDGTGYMSYYEVTNDI